MARLSRVVAEEHLAILRHLEHARETGCTDHELAAVLDIPQRRVRDRRGELLEMQLIVNSGRKRKVPSGRYATVWTAMDRRKLQSTP